jgi:predicted small metal-binding protein
VGPSDWYVRCDCGWEARAPRAEIVRLIQRHALDAHGFEVNEEQALAQARPA